MVNISLVKHHRIIQADAVYAHVMFPLTLKSPVNFGGFSIQRQVKAPPTPGRTLYMINYLSCEKKKTKNGEYAGDAHPVLSSSLDIL